MRRSLKDIPLQDWQRWPVVCPATTAHRKVRRDDEGKLWEIERATHSVVKAKPFTPTALIDLFNLSREFKPTGGQHA